jgi:hypothetical protein
MVRQKFLDRLLDQNLNRDAAQDRSELELPVFGLGNARAELRFGLGAAGGQGGIRYSWAAAYTNRRKFPDTSVSSM